jgi:glycine hydroxymethyltransferase
MTSRGLAEADWQQVAGFLHEALELCKEVQASSGKLLKDFLRELEGNAKLADLRSRVEAFAAAFPMPGFEL